MDSSGSLSEVGQVVLDQQSNHSVRSDSEVESGETDPELEDSFSLDGLHGAVQESRVRELSIGTSLHLLELGLKVIRGETHDGSDDTSDGGGSQSGGEGVLGSGDFVESVLDLIIGGEGSDVDGDSSDDGGGRSSPESEDTLFSDNSCEGIEEVLVVSSLSRGEMAIRLESDENEIGGVSDEGSQESGNDGRVGLFPESEIGGGVLSLDVVTDGLVDTESSGGVGGLSDKGGVESLVKSSNSLLSLDVVGDVEGGKVGLGASSLSGGSGSLRLDLDSDLDSVDGLDNSGGAHSGETSDGEGLDDIDPGLLSLGRGSHTLVI